MAKYTVVHSCGHTETVRLFGKNADRERKIEWLEREGLCSECYKVEIERKRQERKEELEKRAAELPELTGSERQIAWAMTLRDKVMQELEYVKADEEYHEFLANQTESRYWIDTRHQRIDERLDWVDEELDKRETDNSDVAKAAMDEATVYPKDQKTKDVAEISKGEGYVKLVSPKNETIRMTIKELGWTWSKTKCVWYHNTGVVNGSAEDRIAEAGNALLVAGVPIRIFDEYIREKAISGDYEPIYPYWIVAESFSGKIKATWNNRLSEELYDKIKSLPNAKYKDGEIYLDAKYYEEIKDFCSLYGFRISTGAEKVLTDAEKYDKAKTIVKPRKGKKAIVENGEKALKEILESSREILEDLKEEEV